MPQLTSKITVSVSLALAVYATDQAENGADIDLGDYESCAISFIFGTVTDGTYALKLEYSDDGGSTYADVPAADIQGTLTGATATSDDTIQTVGYIGKAGIIRPVVTVASSTTGALLTVVATRSTEKQVGGSSIIT